MIFKMNHPSNHRLLLYYIHKRTYIMLKLNSKSLLSNELEEGLLKDHLDKLVQREQEKVKELLLRQYEKESRIEAVQRQFIDWAGKKQQDLRDRLEKHSKNKEEHLNKIVKKCKQHEKFLGEKLKTYQSKKKASLRQAWKLAQKYKNSAEDFQASKNASKEKSVSRVKVSQDLAQSHMLPGGSDQKEYLSVHYNNPNISKLYGNASKDYWAELNQSVRQLRFTQQPTFSTEGEERHQEKDTTTDKLQQTLVRWKQHSVQAQQSKIQQLGERLQKIERGRQRKFELVKKKREKQPTATEGEDENEERRPKRKADRSQRVHSEVMIREKRVRDYTSMNKHKRDEYFQTQLQNGTEYLQNQKIKFLKATLAKKVAVSAIEKKLYFERLNH